jgi:hypothetical protein
MKKKVIEVRKQKEHVMNEVPPCRSAARWLAPSFVWHRAQPATALPAEKYHEGDEWQPFSASAEGVLYHCPPYSPPVT